MSLGLASSDLNWQGDFFPYPVDMNGNAMRMPIHLEQQFDCLVMGLLNQGSRVALFEAERNGMKGFIMTSWKPKQYAVG